MSFSQPRTAAALVAIALAGVLAGGQATAADRGDIADVRPAAIPVMASGTPSAPPSAFVDFCRRSPSDCADPRSGLSMDEARRNAMRLVWAAASEARRAGRPATESAMTASTTSRSPLTEARTSTASLRPFSAAPSSIAPAPPLDRGQIVGRIDWRTALRPSATTSAVAPPSAERHAAPLQPLPLRSQLLRRPTRTLAASTTLAASMPAWPAMRSTAPLAVYDDQDLGTAQDAVQTAMQAALSMSQFRPDFMPSVQAPSIPASTPTPPPPNQPPPAQDALSEAASTAQPTQAIVRLDRETAARVNEINRRVNREIRRGSDASVFGREDYWQIPVQGGRGDCEDYVLAKRRALVAAGVPASALSIAIVRTRWNEVHAVLLLASDQGEMVLDNLTPWISRWDRVDYTWQERQRAGRVFEWVRMSS